jgi:hypothetical protein
MESNEQASAGVAALLFFFPRTRMNSLCMKNEDFQLYEKRDVEAAPESRIIFHFRSRACNCLHAMLACVCLLAYMEFFMEIEKREREEKILCVI